MTQGQQLELFSRLESVPWQAIYNEAVSIGVSSEEIKDETKEEIINRLVRAGVDNERLKLLIDKYAYGKIVSISLWHLEGNCNEDTLQRLEKLLNSEFKIGATNFRRLKIAAINERSNRIELVFKYSKRYVYLDENEVEQIIWEQRRGCAWVGINQPYLAVIGKDEKVWTKVVEIIAEQLERKPIPARPPQRAIDRCFDKAIPSRMTLVGREGEKTTFSRSEGLTPEQQKDLERYSENQRRIAGTFRTSIGEYENISARFNSSKGNITIQKFLPAEALFNWTERAIGIILEEINNLKGRPLREIFASQGKEIIWNGVQEDLHSKLEWILSQLLSASPVDNVEIHVDDSMIEFLENPKFFISVYRPICRACDSPTGAICGECGSNLSVNDIKRLQCPSGHQLIGGNEYRLVCPENHALPILEARHCWYFPTPNLCRKLDQNIQKIFPGSNLAKRWYIANMQMVIHRERNYSREISLSELNLVNIDNNLITNERKEYLVKLKEKCSTSRNLNCGNCVTKIQGLCLMRIFHPIITGFRPQPHRGGEYGDISGQLLWNGQTLEMKGIIKSNTKSRSSLIKKITSPMSSSSTAGQEIIRQIVEQGLNDSRCDLITIIVPQYLDADFKGTLRFLCRLGNKYITFIQLDELCYVLSEFKNHFATTDDLPEVINEIP